MQFVLISNAEDGGGELQFTIPRKMASRDI